MKRQARLAAALAVAVLAGGAGPALAETTLTVAHGFSPTHVIAAQGVDPWMACMKAKAGDQLGFNYYPSGQVASTKEMLTALNAGIADLTTVPIGYVSSKMPLNGVSMLPGLGSSAGQVIPVYSKAVRQGLLAKEFEQNHIRPIWVMVLPAYQIVSRVGPLRTKEDFAGKVVRSAGGTMNLTLSALGASPAEIPSSDMYVAMERGTVDATLSAYASIKPYNINEVMNAVSANGEFGSFSIAFSMSDSSWTKLSPELQQMASDCGSQVEGSIARFLDGEVDELKAEFSKAGVTVYDFTPEQLAWMHKQLGQVSDDWVARLKDRGLPAQQALDEYRKLMGVQ
ncbi:TRAP-type C4-dicarboxylate transport system, substrate-binding protein [Tistlia consotensis]|uniref:TRAP-type C4-dicarboxylate transport system, substrate-binding protein n=1 Tax=Tistlia consotensis USBA 355 TaxID=560819 RepID=A0A1Y6CHJ1_9PROT|nr:TRAP transporter substrate-binding protein DctP [Tistlia consotensis]SMF65815.1 TRAP-type C4-dicarboxylate transport system, substrate-binding protein [Tistlia consotensis USBA 355]SNS03124.1 TRAP-type C4-dicarboxylate transport system, substrate-binding protein [Tistlia consotensis]